MLSKEQFKKLSKEKQWNYLEYIQNRRTNSYLYMTNVVIILLSFFTLTFAALELFIIGFDTIKEIFFNSFFIFMILIVMTWISILIVKKYKSNLMMKKELMYLSEGYFK